MKKTINALTLFLAIGMVAFLPSCTKEETIPSPVISDFELGLANSLVAYVGADLHMEANIVAEGKIDKITVEIHQEDGGTHELEEDFTEFEGLKNATFHEHVEIPDDFEPGDYHFHFMVTDQEGNSTSFEEEIELKELVDNEAPTLTFTTSPSNGQAFANGEMITIEGTVTDNIALGGMFIGLVYESDDIANADVLASNAKVITMLHTHDFSDPDEYDFSASIEVGAANDNNMTPAPIEGENAWKSGNYYILVRVKDAAGTWTFSDKYPVTINL